MDMENIDKRMLEGAAVGLIVILAAGFIALSGGNADTPGTTSEINPVNDSNTPDTDQSSPADEETFRKIEIEAGSYYFEPETVEVDVNQTVQFNFVNTDGSHNFRIPEISRGTKTLIAGRNRSLNVTFSEAGRFNFICSVPGHADRGMNGTIIVS